MPPGERFQRQCVTSSTSCALSEGLDSRLVVRPFYSAVDVLTLHDIASARRLETPSQPEIDTC